MFSHLSMRDLAVIAILLDADEVVKNRCHRFGVHKCLRRRKVEGEYWTLYKKLTDDEEKFFQYFRMSEYSFNFLLGKIENSLRKKDTTFKEAISPKEKLAVCLRQVFFNNNIINIQHRYNYPLDYTKENNRGQFLLAFRNSSSLLTFYCRGCVWSLNGTETYAYCQRRHGPTRSDTFRIR